MNGLARRTRTAMLYGAIALVAFLAPSPVFPIVLVAVGALAARELRELARGSSWPRPVVLVVGMLYLAAGLAALGLLWSFGDQPAAHGSARGLPVWLLLAVVPTWAADIAAYLVGARWGTRRLAPRVSPGKTWEGTIAGFLAGGLAAFGLVVLFGLSRPLAPMVAFAIGPVALFGDLIESALKRSARSKDSGGLLPGHGGVLDRIDSVLAVGLVVALLRWIALG